MENLPDETPKHLQMNSECNSLREAQNIAEEVNMMLQVYAEQDSVVKEYRQLVQQLSDEERSLRRRDARSMEESDGQLPSHRVSNP